MARWQGRIPLFVGVSGHRSLHPEDALAVRERLQPFLDGLRASLRSTPVVVVSRLAEGVDQLVVSIAVESGCESAYVPPVDRDAYRASFQSDAARAEFDRLSALSTLQDPASGHPGEVPLERGYALAGHYIARHATILLAVWDGAGPAEHGNTADVVRMRASAWIGPGTGAVYHLPLRPREPRSDQPQPRIDPVDGRTPDIAAAAQELSAAHAIEASGWEHVEEFNRAVLAAGHRITELGAAHPFEFVTDARFNAVAMVLTAARTLAADLQSSVRRRKLALQVIAFLAAISFVVIFKTNGARWLVWIYLALLAAALTLRTLTRREAIHRRYLDYRCLTEGLRVVLFWRLAGLNGDPGVHTVTVRLISRQDPSLLWIASALSGLAGWIGRLELPAGFDGFDFAARHWLGSDASDEPGAQIPYYRRAAHGRRRLATRLDRIAQVTLISGILAAAALALLPMGLVGKAAPFLLAFMGFLPLVSSTASGIADLPAELGIARQYEGMADLLESAGRRLAASTSDAERRQVLFEAGTSALAEHSFWHTVFRERAPERRVRV